MKRPAFIQALLATLLAAHLSTEHALAQATPPPTPTDAGAPPSGITVTSQPSGIWLTYSSGLEVRGRSPLVLPPQAVGRFRILAEGLGVARTQGVFRIAAPGIPAEYLSEPNGMSATLLVHAVNYPGLADISADRETRGMSFFWAEGGAIFGAVYSHLKYHDRLDEFGPYAADRAEDERHQRNYWITYGAAVWAASALDYMIRPRYTVRETSPNGISIDVPELSRGSGLWRSVVVPGAGQEYANHRFRGKLWITAALMAGAGVVFANISADHDQTQLDWAIANADSAGPSEKQAKEQEVVVMRNEVQQSQEQRRWAIFGLAAVWAANVLDAATMDVPKTVAKSNRLGLAFPITPEGPAASLSYRF